MSAGMFVAAWLAFNALVFAFLLWRNHADRRRERRAEARLVAMASPHHQERAAQAALRPRTGNVVPFPRKPPTNGKP